MPWETFDKRSGRLVKVPEVTIQRSGSIGINAAAAYLIGEPEAVEMMFDREQNRVGVRPVPRETAHAYPCRPIKNRASFLVNCTAFFEYYRIPHEESVRREVTVEEGVLVVDLNDAGRVSLRGNAAHVRVYSNGQVSAESEEAALAEAGQGGSSQDQ